MAEELNASFGKRLRSIRNDKNLSQDKMAQALSVTRQTVSSWERDKSYPGLEELDRIAEFLQISTNDLLHDREQNSASTDTACDETEPKGTPALSISGELRTEGDEHAETNFKSSARKKNKKSKKRKSKSKICDLSGIEPNCASEFAYFKPQFQTGNDTVVYAVKKKDVLRFRKRIPVERYLDEVHFHLIAVGDAKTVPEEYFKDAYEKSFDKYVQNFHALLECAKMMEAEEPELTTAEQPAKQPTNPNETAAIQPAKQPINPDETLAGMIFIMFTFVFLIIFSGIGLATMLEYIIP